jgi:hypothetical protein
LNRREIAAMLSDINGHQVEARTSDPSALGPKAAGLRPMIEHYDRHGLVGNAQTLRAILGREPRSLRSYFEELARTNSWSAHVGMPPDPPILQGVADDLALDRTPLEAALKQDAAASAFILMPLDALVGNDGIIAALRKSGNPATAVA